MIQNADDAKATSARFLLDLSKYSTNDLFKPELESFQGLFPSPLKNFEESRCATILFTFPIPPVFSFFFFLFLLFFTTNKGPALYVFNDQQFSENDLRNIAHFGSRGKASDLEKTGTFGIGFSTIFAITDLPCILTGSDLLIFDPNQQYVPGLFSPYFFLCH